MGTPSRKPICMSNFLEVATTDNARGPPRDGICVQWKNGSTLWERRSDLKDSYPIKVTEYANVQGITDEPALVRWVHCVLKSRDLIVATMNRHYHKQTHKIGFEIPRLSNELLKLTKKLAIPIGGMQLPRKGMVCKLLSR